MDDISAARVSFWMLLESWYLYINLGWSPGSACCWPNRKRLISGTEWKTHLYSGKMIHNYVADSDFLALIYASNLLRLLYGVPHGMSRTTCCIRPVCYQHAIYKLRYDTGRARPVVYWVLGSNSYTKSHDLNIAAAACHVACDSWDSLYVTLETPVRYHISVFSA